MTKYSNKQLRSSKIPGTSNLQQTYNPERIRTPLARKGKEDSGEYTPLFRDEALDRIVPGLKEIEEEVGLKCDVLCKLFVLRNDQDTRMMNFLLRENMLRRAHLSGAADEK